jgi:subtilisin-like proprotein convertase family protein
MRHGILLLIAAGCGFKSEQSALVPGAARFDSADDFAAPGHVVSAMTIEPHGALTPDAYTYGGLAVHSRVDTKLWAHGAVSWAALDPAMAVGAGLWRGEPIVLGSALEYLHILGKPMKVTLWFEGEIWLEAGSTERFELHGNDVAFIDIAPPGSASYAPLSESSDAPILYPAPVAGWYPIRIGFSDGDASGGFSFMHSDAGGPMVAWTRDRMRTRASAVQGTLRTVFGHQILGGGVNAAQLPLSIIDQIDLLSRTGFDAEPPGLGRDDWSARYAGQLYASEPGDYALRITSDDGNRVRLGPASDEKNWQRDSGVGFTMAETTVHATLAAGWNDFTVDYNQVLGERSLLVDLQGPGDSGFATVPRARLRPVESADDRISTGGDDMDRNVMDNGGPDAPATATVRFAGYPGETVTAIDATYEVDSDHWNQIRIDLESPATEAGPGVRRMIRDHSPSDFNGPRTFQRTITAAAGDSSKDLVGVPSTGEWKLHVYDDVGGGNRTQLRSATLTLHTRGGPVRIAKTASWTSQVLDAATLVRAIDSVAWDPRVPDGAAIEVHVATCQSADCGDAAWSPPVEMGAALDVEPGRYVQIRVDMTSDGVLEPELRSLAVEYHRDP